VLLLLIVGISGARWAAVGGEAPRLEARDEVQWFGWAFREPEALSRLERLRTELRPGEVALLVVPRGYPTAGCDHGALRAAAPEDRRGARARRWAPKRDVWIVRRRRLFTCCDHGANPMELAE
jgi:hypothetical protein